MPRRSLLILLLLATVVTVAVLGPRTPAGRDWLLARVQVAAEDAGWDVRWRASAGNPWRSLELRGLELAGAGIDAAAAYARIRWFAPALLTGELPLWIEVRDADVAIDPAGFAATGGTTGGPPIRPQLRDVDLSGIRLRVGAGDAYRIPDVSVEDVEVRGGDEGIVARGRLATRDGGLSIDATIDLNRSILTAEVRDAELTLARHWWPGVVGGTAGGTVSFSPERGWTGELAMAGGAFEVAGWTVDEIDGPVVLQNALVEAELSGSSLGGSVAATGRVDLANRRWSASARATPDVAAAVGWAAGDALPDELTPAGDALVTATASGWGDVRIDASANAGGTLDGRPFALTTTQAGFDSANGLNLVASGEALGGTLDVTLSGAGSRADASTPGRAPIRAAAALAQASYGPLRAVAGELEWFAGAGSEAGVRFELRADLASASAGTAPPDAEQVVGSVELDGTARDGTTELFGSASLRAGGSLEGAATLAQGRVQGAVRIVDVGPLDGAPVSATLRADGAIDALPLELSVAGDEPWRPAAWTFAPELDLRGSATAVLRGARLEQLEGTFGPLSVAGTAALTAAAANDGRDAALAGRIAPIRFELAAASGSIAVDDLVVVPWTADGTTVEGTVRSRSLAAAGERARIDDLDAQLRAELPLLPQLAGSASGWRVRLDGPSLRARLEGATPATARVAADLDRLVAELAGVPTETTGAFSLDLADPLASLRGSVDLRSVRTTSQGARAEAGAASAAAPSDGASSDLLVSLTRDDAATRLVAELPAGFRLGAVALPSDVRATGRLPGGGDGELRIEAGAVRFDGSAAAPEGELGRLAIEGTLTTGGERAEVRLAVADRSVRLDGPIDLAPLGRWAGLDIAGAASADAARLTLGDAATPGSAAGTLTARLTAPLPADARWQAGRLAGTVDTPVGRVDLAGTAAPGQAVSATARHPWGAVTWTDGDLRGGGTTPEIAWRGTTLRSVAWRLDAPDGATGPLTIVADRSRARWDAGRLVATIDLPLEVGRETARLVGDASWSTTDGAAALAAAVVAPDGARWAQAQGRLPSLELRLDAPAPVVAAAADGPDAVAGRVVLQGPWNLATLAGRATGRWTHDDVGLDIEVERSDERLHARLDGAGLDATVDDGGARITASDTTLDALVPALQGLVLDGALSFRSQTGLAGWRDATWQGGLAVLVPDVGELLLAGSEGPLTARLASDASGVRTTVEGTLLPALELVVTAEHAPTGARLAIDARTPPDAWSVNGIRVAGDLRLPSQAAGAGGARYEVPQLDARIEGSIERLTIDAGERGAWTVTPDGWSGGVALDASIADRPHPLEVELSGPRLAPIVTADLTGPSATARATFDGATGAGSIGAALEEAAWPPAWSDLGAETARLDASLAGDGVWSGSLTARVTPGDRPLFLSADAEGRGRDATASWLAADPSGVALLRGEVAADASGLAVVSDAAGWNLPSLVRWAAGDAELPEVIGAASGSLRYERSWAGRSRLNVAASLGGRVGEVGVRAVADVSDAGTLVRVDVGGDAIALERQSGDGGWSLQAAGSRYALRGELDASLRDGRLTGSVADRPIDLRLARNDEGLLAVGGWDDASLSLGVLRERSTWRAEIDASLPASPARTWSGRGAVALLLDAGALRLERLDASVEGPVAGSIELTGGITPELDLAGRWSGPPAQGDGSIPIELEGPLPGWRARADVEGLELAIVGDRAALRSVAAVGSTDVVPLLRVDASGDGLLWSADAGWMGSASAVHLADDATREAGPSLSIGAEGRDGRLQLTGDGRFGTVAASVLAEAAATLDGTVTGPPWAADVTGRLLLDGTISGRAAGPGAGDEANGLAASIDLALGGTLLRPSVTGSALLEGVARASGPVEAGLDGLSIRLDGEELRLDARADTGSWSLDAVATGLSLAPWLPELADPRLGAQISAEGGWSSRPLLTAEELLLSADGATLRGDAELSTGLRADFELDADLQAALGGDARGHLVGPVRVEADALASLADVRVDAALRADEVELAGVAIDGRLDASGSLPVPALRADLRLGGPVVGDVRATWLPDRSLAELSSDLRARRSDPSGRAAWTARLDVTATDGFVTAEGVIEAGDGRLRLAPDDATVELIGEDAWTGLRIRVAPFEGERGRVDLDLPLDALADPLSGRLEATLSAETDGLQGTANDVALFATALPTPLRLSGHGTQLRVVDPGGSGLHLALDAADRSWTAEATSLTIDPLGTVRLDATGRGASGAISARVGGPDGGVVDLEATAGDDGFTLAADGTYRGGTLVVTADRAATEAGGSWSGSIRAEGIDTTVGRTGLDAVLSGDAPIPDVVSDVTVDGPVPVAGRVVAVGARQASIDLAADLPGGESLTVQGDAWPNLDLRVSAQEGVARLRAPAWNGTDAWTLEGATLLALPGIDAVLAGERVGDTAGVPTLRARSPLVSDASLRTELPIAAPAAAIRRLAQEGLVVTSEGSLGGSIAWRPELGLLLDDLSWRAPVGDVTLAGTVDANGADLRGVLSARPDDAGLAARSWTTFSDAVAQPFAIEGPLNAVTLRTSDGPLPGRLAWAADARTVTARFEGATLDVDLVLAPGSGLEGRLRASDLALPLSDRREATFRGSATAEGGVVDFDAVLDGPGRLRAAGSVPIGALLPAPYRTAPDADLRAADLSLRLEAIDLAAVPVVSSALPHLAGSISGIAEVRGRRVVLQLAAPELRTAGRAIPLRIDAGGDLGSSRALSFSGSLAGSHLQGSTDLDELDLLLTLDRFPGQAPIEAVVGSLDADVEATGVLRLTLPWRAPLDGELRIATEYVRLERAGVVTTGVLTSEAARGRLRLEAAFEGDGRWTASANLSADELDVRIDAFDANATPLLGLVPSLARLDTSASGSLTVRASGTPERPRLTAESSELEIGLAGARYRLGSTAMELDGGRFEGRTIVTGVNPVGGRLVVAGTAEVDLLSRALDEAAVTLRGTLEAPLIGTIDAVDGRIDVDEQGRPRLAVDGRLGAPLRVTGTLAPLALRATGSDLALRVPTLLLDRATGDVDLSLRRDDAFRLSGRIAARDGRFALGIRPQPTGPDEGGSRGLRTFLFDDVAIVGRRLAFSENFGSAEFDADLRLSGSAAAPRLSGAATAQRGTLRFSGRDFELDTAVARFEPSRGAYPELEVDAVARFDQRSVLQGAPEGVSFVRPSGSTFDVRLTFDAEVVPTPGGTRPFDLQLDPVLSSNAEIAVPAGQGLTAGTRALREAELLQLIALGRLDLSPDLAAGDVASGVARSALDNAVDLLLLAELQDAVAQALGVDLVEIRTSALSDVLAGGEDPFGVSLRLGGYVDEGLFASFEIGRFADADATQALSNTLALTYELGPVAFDLATRVGFADVGELTTTTEISGTVRYQLTPFLAVEGGATLSTPETEARFGVTLRW